MTYSLCGPRKQHADRSDNFNRVAKFAILGLILALPLGWLAGEQHRENCLTAHHTACTVLPWDQGQQQPQAESAKPSDDYAEKLLRKYGR